MDVHPLNGDPRFIVKSKTTYWRDVFFRMKASEVIRLRIIGGDLNTFLIFIHTLGHSLRNDISRIEFWDIKDWNPVDYANVCYMLPKVKIYFLSTFQ